MPEEIPGRISGQALEGIPERTPRGIPDGTPWGMPNKKPGCNVDKRCLFLTLTLKMEPGS